MDRRDQFEVANRKARKFEATHPKALSANYDQKAGRIVLRLSNGRDLAFSPEDTEGLETATPSQLNPIEISPSGFGIYFPKLDADLHVPSLLEGVFGSKKWIAARGSKKAANENAQPALGARAKAAV
jgi:hypothetical protein